jgi:hypothetical protein
MGSARSKRHPQACQRPLFEGPRWEDYSESHLWPTLAEIEDTGKNWVADSALEQTGILPSLGVPRQGHVLATVAEAYGGPIRKAVGHLSRSLDRQVLSSDRQSLYGCRCQEPGGGIVRPVSDMAAWTVVAAWVTGIATQALSSEANLLDAETWFLGDCHQNGLTMHASERAIKEAEAALQPIADPIALTDLLPYILDPHGPGSRLSVRHRPETKEARIRKRAEGVFYTPTDVATYMVNETLRDFQKGTCLPTVFDPACGTGVFLRSALHSLRLDAPLVSPLDLACSCLYGADIDPWALDATAFVLLCACFDDVAERGIAPVAAWHALRLNLSHVDTLRLDPGKVSPDGGGRISRLDCRARLKAGCIPKPSGPVPWPGRLTFYQLFPELAEGPHVFIGNPPYADLGSNANLLELSVHFETVAASPRPSADVYPLFVEQMIRLSAPDACGALVLPLSIACNTGPQFVTLRALLARTAGTWRFAFFDREPHALFGEDVKTRNAIVLWTRRAGETKTRIFTGPLRKWRGHGRAAMFKNITFTGIETDICPGIPKVEGEDQAHALTRLLMQVRLLRNVVGFGRTTLKETTLSDGRTVHVGSTAYNFLNVFLKPKITGQGDYPLSENPLHALMCASVEDALAVFAALSSRLAFWWWHIHGDGFHVLQRTIGTIPLGDVLLNKRYRSSLATFGKTLWKAVRTKPIISVNRGRMSMGFSATPQHDIRMAIDQFLIETLDLGPAFVTTLERFTERITTAPILGAQ